MFFSRGGMFCPKKPPVKKQTCCDSIVVYYVEGPLKKFKVVQNDHLREVSLFIKCYELHQRQTRFHHPATNGATFSNGHKIMELAPTSERAGRYEIKKVIIDIHLLWYVLFTGSLYMSSRTQINTQWPRRERFVIRPHCVPVN